MPTGKSGADKRGIQTFWDDLMRMLRMLVPFLICLLLFWSVPCFAQGTYYRWVDKDGKVHFSNAPPGDARGVAPLEMRDRPEDIRSTRARFVDEVGDQLSGLMNQARVLIQSGSNSSANKAELKSLASQLEEKLKEYEARANLVIGTETNPLYRKAMVDAADTTRRRVKTHIDLIKKYVDPREVLDQAELKKLHEGPRQSGSMVSDDARISLRNAQITFSSWRPYRSPNRLVQVGMNENEVENIAGQPDEKEFYTDTRQGRFMAIAGWYYANSDRTQITLLEFEIGTRSLIRIASRP